MNRDGIVLVMVGDELLDSRTLDTNSHWLIQRAAAKRWPIERVETVPDDVDAIAGVLHRYVGVCAAVIVTGGLGPTPDDLTREALAKVSGESLSEDAGLLAELEQLFLSRGREMAASNRKQAQKTPSSIVLKNPVGTAPGLWQDISGTAVILVPGVPIEMKKMFEGDVGHRLASRIAALTPESVRLRTTQISESALASKVVEAIGEERARTLAFCVARFGVDLVIRDDDDAGFRATVDALRESLAEYLYAEGDTELNEVVIRTLTKSGKTVAVAESCTGGLVGAALTEVSGSSAVFVGGALTYADEVKIRELGVSSDLIASVGAVSEEVACAMAMGARKRFGVDLAVATTGIAGPGGGTDEKPVGLVWVSLAGPEGTSSRKLQYGGSRDLVRRWTVAACLDLLRRAALA